MKGAPFGFQRVRPLPRQRVGPLVFVEKRNEVKKPRASANGRRWSALGFFQRKSHFGHSSPLFRAGHSGFFTYQ
jgi:hypothetical protein